MAEKQAILSKTALPVVSRTPAPVSALTPVHQPLVQRKCACGGTPGLDGECESCRKKRLSLQRSAANPAAASSPPAVVPNVVRDVMRSSGAPLDAAVRSAMEPRFGHDFSRVRVHIDGRAARSAQAVGARAYTVGQNIVFDDGQYQPATPNGRRLIAHELAHTIQQQGIQRAAEDATFDVSPRYAVLEREAERAADAAMHDAPTQVWQRPAAPLVSRQPNERNWTTIRNRSFTVTGLPVIGAQTFHVSREQSSEDVATAIEETAIAYRVDRLVLPAQKGNILAVYQARAAANALEASVDFGEFRRATQRQGRDPDSVTQQRWIEKVGWDNTCRDKLWHEAGGHPVQSGPPPTTGCAQTATPAPTDFLKAGSETANVDHILELQLGGTGMASNMQMLEAGANQQAGVAIIAPQIRDLASAIRNYYYPNDPRPRVLTLSFQTATMVGSPNMCASVNCNHIRQGRAQFIWQVECCAQQAAACAPSLCGTPSTAAAAVTTVQRLTIRAGGAQADLVHPARQPSGDLPVPIWADPPGSIPPENIRAADLIAGLFLSDLTLRGASSRQRGAKDHIDAKVDTRTFQGRSGQSNAPRVAPGLRSTAATNTSIRLHVEADGTLLMQTRSQRLAFHYPYLSDGMLSVNYDPGSGIRGTGTIRPSPPLLNRAVLNIRMERGQLTAVAPIPSSMMRPPIPGFRMTRGELGVELSPQFRPYGTLGFEIGPRGRPVFDGSLDASADENGLVFQGILNAHLPRVDQARGEIAYRNRQWTGGVVIRSTQIGIPGIQSGELRVDYNDQGPQVSGRVVIEVSGQQVELGVVRRGGNWIYTGRGRFNIPRLRPVNLNIEYDGRHLTGTARTGVDFAGFSGDVTVNYRDGRFSGEGQLRFSRGRANGSAQVRVSPQRRISGEGQIQYRLTDNLIGTVGIQMPETGPVRVSGALEFTQPIPLFRRFGNERELFRRSIDIPIPGASIGPVGLQARLTGAMGINYFIGAGELRNVRIAAAFNPLDENPNLDIQAGAQLVIPAGAGLWVSIEGGVAISAYIASISGTIRATGRAALEGGISAGINITYRNSRFTAEAPLELVVRPRITLSLDAVAAAEAGIAGFSVRTEKVWNLASYSWGANFQVGLRTRIAYASDTGLQIPSLEQIEFVHPQLDVGSILSQIFGASSSREREV